VVESGVTCGLFSHLLIKRHLAAEADSGSLVPVTTFGAITHALLHKYFMSSLVTRSGCHTVPSPNLKRLSAFLYIEPLI